MRYFCQSWLLALYLLCLFHATTAQQRFPTPAEWWKSVCRGTKLHAAMSHSEPFSATFAQPMKSPWDGTLVNELREWGYTESARHQLCDFEQYWDFRMPFWYYKMDPRPIYRGGPNMCFDISHGDSFARRADGSKWPMAEQTYVKDGKTYRKTGAFSTIGINAPAGHIFFIARKGPQYAARELWKMEPSPDDLPALRAQSDFAWGFWNRMNDARPIKNINAFWVLSITNRETNAIINQAHLTYSQNNYPPPGRTLVWPGVTFDIEALEGQALLGSPNGLAIGYFLAQHKRQLGGNKIIKLITVFRNDKEEDTLPNMIFWVDEALGTPTSPGEPPNPFAPNRARDVRGSEESGARYEGARVVGSSKDGLSVLREHVFRLNMTV